MQINGLRFMMVGGASGMGRATAERVAAGGGKVAILDRAGSAGAERHHVEYVIGSRTSATVWLGPWPTPR